MHKLMSLTTIVVVVCTWSISCYIVSFFYIYSINILKYQILCSYWNHDASRNRLERSISGFENNNNRIGLCIASRPFGIKQAIVATTSTAPTNAKLLIFIYLVRSCLLSSVPVNSSQVKNVLYNKTNELILLWNKVLYYFAVRSFRLELMLICLYWKLFKRTN